MSETESACVCVRGCSQTSFFLLTVSVFSEAALLGMLFSFSFPKNFSRGFLVWTVLMLPKALKHSSCSCLQEHCQLLEQEHEILCCLFTTFLFRTSSLYFALHETSFLFFFFSFSLSCESSHLKLLWTANPPLHVHPPWLAPFQLLLVAIPGRAVCWMGAFPIVTAEVTSKE